MRTIVLAVGRLRPPYADDVQHYQKLLARHARLELVELRDEEKVDGRIPERAYVCLLDSGGKTFDSIGFSRFLEERRQSGAGSLLRGRRAARTRSRHVRPAASRSAR